MIHIKTLIAPIKGYFPTSDIANIFNPTFDIGAKNWSTSDTPTPDTRHYFPKTKNVSTSYEGTARKGLRGPRGACWIAYVQTRHSKPSFISRHYQKFELDTRHLYPPLWARLMVYYKMFFQCRTVSLQMILMSV